MVFLLQFLPILFFLGLAYFIGGLIERRHIASLEEREAKLQHILTTQTRSFPMLVSHQTPPTCLIGETVISSDYLKTFLAFFRNIFGGEVKSFRTIMERARRESLLRVKEQAQELGYNALCNVRFDTADVAGSGSRKKIVMASIVASATAYHAESRSAM